MGDQSLAGSPSLNPASAERGVGDVEMNDAMDPAAIDAALSERLGRRSVVMVGLPGVGKSSVGRRLAARLGLSFVDADTEIERAAGMTVTEIFAKHGEPAFRDGEQRVIARLLEDGPMVLATGGGAYMSAATRIAIAKHGVAIWLDAATDVLVARIAKRSNRPMFIGVDPRAKVMELRALRDPVFAGADIHVISSAGPHERVVRRIVEALRRHFSVDPSSSQTANARKGNIMSAAGETTRPAVPHEVGVELGERSYKVVIGDGLFEQAGARVAAETQLKRAIVVSDTTVAHHHMSALCDALGPMVIARHVVEPGETSKSWAAVTALVEAILDAELERGDGIVALGGGVVGDLAGFAAAIARRGMPFVQVPTSLLAQVDSAVGGKTGINTRHGKNLVGAFHQPALVLADTGALATLSDRERRAGYAEIVKMALVRHPEFFERLDALADPTRDEIAASIATAVAGKAEIVAADEREAGQRALLNLGHTFAHAIERIANYDGRVVHGEAVALGICLAFRFSHSLGLSSHAEAERVAAHMARVGLPIRLDKLPLAFKTDALIGAMGQDKKVKDGVIRFVLVRGIGRAFVSDGVPADTLATFLKAEGAQPS